tara:strand:+ start:8553 stop:9758 length:1206 start_codon:yes stop_codon:yes gene_type:complete
MVPEGWKPTKLGDISSLVTSGSRDWAKFYSDSGSMFIRMTNLRRDGIHLKMNDLKFVNIESDSADGKRTSLQAGDILISITAELGKIGWVPPGLGEAYINQHTALVRVKPTKSESKFVAYLLSSKPYHRRINALNDAGAKAGLNLATIRSLPIALPTIPEQKKIAQILSTWDQAITATERLLENSQQRKKGLMQQLLTGKKRLPGFEAEWEETQMGNLFAERSEIGVESLPLLSITSADGVVYQDETGRKDTSNADKSKYKRICPGDIGYNTMRMWQGRSSLSDKDGVVSPAYTILAPREDTDSLFFSYLFKLPEMIHVFYRHSQGLVSDTWNLKYNHFRKIVWKVPPKTEQSAIAKILLAADFEISALKVRVDCLKQEKKALMQQLLTGNRRVQVDAEAA